MLFVQILQNYKYFEFILVNSSRSSGAQNIAQADFYRQNYSVQSKKYINRDALQSLSWYVNTAIDDNLFAAGGGIPRNADAQSKKILNENEHRVRGDGTFTQDSTIAARRRLNEIITCNLSRNLKFLTLTEDDEHKSQSFEEALNAVQNFFRRLTRYVRSKRTAAGERYPDVVYIAIPELGSKNGRLHWHIILIMPYIPKKTLAEKIWGRGFVDVKSLKCKDENATAKQISTYVSKYVTSEIAPIVGRKMIYYASKGWKSNKSRAVLSYPQAQKIFNVMKNFEDKKCIDAGFWSFCNYRNGEVDKFECEKWRVKRLFPSPSQISPADVIKIKWRIPIKYKNAFFSMLESLHVQIERVGIIGKTQEQRDCAARRKAQSEAFIKIRENDCDVLALTSKLAPLFPHVNAGYIYGVLNYYSRPENDENVINNFDALEYFYKTFNPTQDKIPAYLRPLLYIRLPKKRYIPLDRSFKFMRKFRYCEA